MIHFESPTARNPKEELETLSNFSMERLHAWGDGINGHCVEDELDLSKVIHEITAVKMALYYVNLMEQASGYPTRFDGRGIIELAAYRPVVMDAITRIDEVKRHMSVLIKCRPDRGGIARQSFRQALDALIPIVGK